MTGGGPGQCRRAGGGDAVTVSFLIITSRSFLLQRGGCRTCSYLTKKMQLLGSKPLSLTLPAPDAETGRRLTDPNGVFRDRACRAVTAGPPSPATPRGPLRPIGLYVLGWALLSIDSRNPQIVLPVAARRGHGGGQVRGWLPFVPATSTVTGAPSLWGDLHSAD